MIFKKLLTAKNHKGPLTENILPQNKFYLYAVHNKRGIINLEYTLQNIKRSLKLISKFLTKIRYYPKTRILIFINDSSLKIMSSILKTNKRFKVIDKKWTPGTLTKNYYNREKFSLVISFSESNNTSLLTECRKLRIPTIFFSNLNFELNDTNYPIPTNTKNIKSLYFLISLLNKYIK